MVKEIRRLSVVGHLEELRRRLLVCVIAVLVFSFFGFQEADWILDWLKRPAASYLPFLSVLSPTEALFGYFKIAVIFGVAASFPIIIYELWAFLRPALSEKEHTSAFFVVFSSSFLFLAGSALGYYFLLPFFIKFLLGIGKENFVAVISVTSYISFSLGIIISCGVIFEMPLVIWILSRFGLLGPDRLREGRAYALILILVVAAFLSPTTDALSLLSVAVPMLVLYEISVLVSGLGFRKKD